MTWLRLHQADLGRARSLHELAPEVPYALVEITEKAMAKLPQNRYPSARAMLEALDTYVQNPSVLFEYQYITEEAPEKVVKRTMNQNRAIRQNEQPAPRKKARENRAKTPQLSFAGLVRHHHCLCTGLHGTVLDDPERLLQPDEQQGRCHPWRLYRHDQGSGHGHGSNRIRPDLPGVEEEYNSNYAAGYIYKQSPVSGRTVREGQSVTLTVSLGTQYVTVPDLTNYVQTDAEQQLKALGVSVLVTQAVDTSVASGAVIRTDLPPVRSGGRLYGQSSISSSAGRPATTKCLLPA